MGYNLTEVVNNYFNMDVSSDPFGEGHINDTYLAKIVPDRHVIQRINHHVFHNPEKLMENIMMVTEHLRAKIIARDGNPERETLKMIKTLDGKDYYKSEDGNYFRVYMFVDDVDVYQTVEQPELFYKAARAFGRFQKDLADFPADRLFETIPNFHNTKVRFEALQQAIKKDKVGRKNRVRDEIEFALARKKCASVVTGAIEKGEIPLRVTHNDTKLNNVLFDSKTGEGICVIDLDTVMPGSLLYDFGDAIRFGASTAAEDEKDLSKVECSLELFEAFTKGFLEELGGTLTEKEVKLLAFSAKLITYECGMRFLTDYLNGDEYFKIHRPEHNLDRCRTQFKLVADMEGKMGKMEDIVRKYV